MGSTAYSVDLRGQCNLCGSIERQILVRVRDRSRKTRLHIWTKALNTPAMHGEAFMGPVLAPAVELFRSLNLDFI